MLEGECVTSRSNITNLNKIKIKENIKSHLCHYIGSLDSVILIRYGGENLLGFDRLLLEICGGVL